MIPAFCTVEEYWSYKKKASTRQRKVLCICVPYICLSVISLPPFTLHLADYSLVRLIVGFCHRDIDTFHLQLCSEHSVVWSMRGVLSVNACESRSVSWCVVKSVLGASLSLTLLNVKLCPLYFALVSCPWAACVWCVVLLLGGGS